MAELTGTSQAGIIRQIVRGLRLGRPELLVFGNERLVFAEEATHTGGEGIEAKDEKDMDVTEEGNIEAINSK
jgi:hypothetical protein